MIPADEDGNDACHGDGHNVDQDEAGDDDAKEAEEADEEGDRSDDFFDARKDDKFPWKSLFPVHEKSDFALMIWTRRLCLAGDLVTARDIIRRFPFWFGPDTNRLSQVFWTENHMLAVASSEYLLKQLVHGKRPEHLHDMLVSLLDLKARAGMAEFLSAVYLPYSLGAILNLYDFTQDVQMKSHCEVILHKVGVQIAHVMLEDGSFVSPCGRTYKKFLTRTFGHHLHEFIAFITGLSLQQVGLQKGRRSFFLREILNTTTYQPDIAFYRAVSSLTGDQITINVSPTTADVMQLADEWIANGYPRDEVMSLLWSHGLYAPPAKIKMLKQCVNERQLWGHPHFRSVQSLAWTMSSAPSSWLRSLATSSFIEYFRKGSALTNAKLTIYREKNVMLASLVGYNSGFAAFQQWPWVANLAGTPIWVTLEKRSNDVSDFASDGTKQMQEITTALHRSRGLAKGFPHVTQTGNMLRADYSAILERNKNHRIRVYWPEKEFDRQDIVVFQNGATRKQTWRYAVKGGAVVAFHISHEKNVIFVIVKSLSAELGNNADGGAEPAFVSKTTPTAMSDEQLHRAELLQQRLATFFSSLADATSSMPGEPP